MIFLRYYTNLTDYGPFRNVVIIDITGFVANLFNFLIVAYVLYKSSKVVGLKHDPILKQDVSLLAYMRNQFAVQQKEDLT